jgi:hypothetical protein
MGSRNVRNGRECVPKVARAACCFKALSELAPRSRSTKLGEAADTGDVFEVVILIRSRALGCAWFVRQSPS